MEKFRVPVAVVVMMTRESGCARQLLLQRRKNTGFGDGMWDFACSGHVEEGESLTEACARECGEELSVRALPKNFHFFTLIYKKDGEVTYVNPYFHLTEYEGTPRISEPGKCSEMCWFDESALPSDLLPDRRAALEAFISGRKLIEYGFDA